MVFLSNWAEQGRFRMTVRKASTAALRISASRGMRWGLLCGCVCLWKGGDRPWFFVYQFRLDSGHKIQNAVAGIAHDDAFIRHDITVDLRPQHYLAARTFMVSSFGDCATPKCQDP